MPLVTYRNLVFDVNDVDMMGTWWAPRLGLEFERVGEFGRLAGADTNQTIWLVPVPEPKTVKNRVHIDLIAPGLELFADCEMISDPGLPWSTFLDPEGGEFCVFVHAGEPHQLKDIVVDTNDAESLVEWWASVLGGEWDEDEGDAWIDDVPGVPMESFDFCFVPEEKSTKNRIHWDVVLNQAISVADLEGRGARVLAEREHWTVMADPHGNEFCVFGHEARVDL
jgi:hypothetical protein